MSTQTQVRMDKPQGLSQEEARRRLEAEGPNELPSAQNINSAKPTPGWDQIMSLPRRLTLISHNELGVEPAGDIAGLRGAHRHLDETALPAHREVVLDGVRGNALEITAELDLRKSPMVELNVLRSPGKEEFTRIAFFKQRGYQNWDRLKNWYKWFETCDSVVTIDSAYSSELPDVTSRAPESAPFWLAPDEPLKLRVFIDRSVVEVFVNGRQCVALRVYPGRADSLGVSLRAQGQDAKLISLEAWQMKDIYAQTNLVSGVLGEIMLRGTPPMNTEK